MPGEPFDEHAKAAQEIAKTAGKAIDAAEKVGEFAARTFSGAIGQLGSMAAETFGYWRLKNLVAIFNKTEKLLEANPKAASYLRSLPPRQVIPLLEAMANEDDESIQDIWAKYLASGTTDGGAGLITRQLTAALKAIEPVDVLMIQFIAKLAPEKPRKEREVVSSYHATKCGVPSADIEPSLVRLASLGLLSFVPGQTDEYLALETSPHVQHFIGCLSIDTTLGQYAVNTLMLTLLTVIRKPRSAAAV